MQRKLGILFLVSVVLSFFAGLYATRIVPSLKPDNAQDAFTYVTEFLKENYLYDITDDDEHEAFVRSLEAMISTYAERHNDPYTRLVMTPLSVSPSSDESFIGMGIRFFFENNNLRIEDLVPGSSLIGLLIPGDLIVGIIESGVPTYFNALSGQTEVLSYLTGTQGSVKTLLVKTQDLNELEVTFEFREILTPTVYTKDLNEANIAYIKITQFSGGNSGSNGTHIVFDQILRSLQQSILLNEPEQKTLILDLRDNPGGSLSALHNSGSGELGIVQQLLPRNTDQILFSMVSANGTIQRFYGQSATKPYDIKVLVNEHSASAAEVLAAALSTAGGYQLYGTTTYGKGVFQNGETILQDNVRNVRYSLSYTQGRWYYGDNLNVETDPLQVDHIPQLGIKKLNMPIYPGILMEDQVSLSLSAYQSFLNYYFQFEGAVALRTDGYFDQKTKDAFILFQSQHDLTPTGILNRETAMIIDNIYRTHLLDLTKDIQLQSLIELIKSS
jgi:carboxyl-terminal processing protease